MQRRSARFQVFLPHRQRTTVADNGNSRTIARAIDGRHNNFNLLRMIAASCVLISHSWSLAFTSATAEPLTSFTPFSLGQLSVTLFFGLSGFLIAKSFDNRRSITEFIVARVFRLYPGLLLSLVFCVFVIGVLWTVEPLLLYFRDPITWKFIPAGLTLFRLKYALPGVFEHNPHFGVNGSLWTLSYEVFCYICVALIGFCRVLAPRAFAVVFVAYLSVYTYLRIHLGPSASMGGYTELTLPFALGVTIYVYRTRIPLNAIVLASLFIGVALLRRTALYREAIVVTVVYATFWLGLVRSRLLLQYNKIGDYSYGMYIFAFPVQQALAASFTGITPCQMIAVAWPTTLVLAVLSWHLVENPILMKRHVFGGFLDRQLHQLLARPGGPAPSNYPLQPKPSRSSGLPGE